ncbi:MAG: 23S rRNA (guanosine(2251)-2'-O)-methyltransferase RlmB [Gammaproteobacteria bacterium]|nr:23S rRNA (guanosine(2251)-2'-O)-methyltransferase RlmB [Gammaproteobacteria bacterium]
MAARLEKVCGFHAVNALLKRAPDRIQALYIDRSRRDGRVDELQQLAKMSGITVSQVDSRKLDKQADGVRHQGVLALARAEKQRDESALYELLDTLPGPPLLLVLDQVQDPHNLGACLRTADGAGVDAVILPRDGAAPVNETVRRVAAGAADRVAVFHVTNLSRCLKQLSERGIWITGSADESAQNVYELDLTGSCAIVMGAEEKGLRRLTREHCDQIAAIPMAGSVSSLNVSVATGVMLFEAVRQRRETVA